MNAVDVAVSLLVPVGTSVVAVRGARAGRTIGDRVGAGEHVVLVDGARLSPRRLRRVAREAGLVVDRELTVLPSLSAPAFVVEDAVTSVRWCWNAFATVPPGRTSGALLITLVTRLVRHRPFVHGVGHLVAGRLVVAHRP